jgi:hypothetical protein
MSGPSARDRDLEEAERYMRLAESCKERARRYEANGYPAVAQRLDGDALFCRAHSLNLKERALEMGCG